MSEQSILSTVMRVPDAHEGMAKIHDMLLEHKEELMEIIETHPAVMGGGRASSVSSEKQNYINEAANMHVAGACKHACMHMKQSMMYRAEKLFERV